MITAAVLDKLLGFLASLFRDMAADDGAAREAARSSTATYGARDDRELRLAALSIAFSFGALDALSRAADPDLPPNQVLRLRGNTNALSRAALQTETRLEKAQRQPAEQATAAPGPAPQLPASPDTQDLVDFIRAAWKAEKAAAAVQSVGTLSRQERRFAERQADKQRQRELEQARLAQRAARRDVGCPGLAAIGA